MEEDDDEIEELLDTLWENWESRRRCEKTHIPNYKKKTPDNEEGQK
jgi:hypothetical protein